MTEAELQKTGQAATVRPAVATGLDASRRQLKKNAPDLYNAGVAVVNAGRTIAEHARPNYGVDTQSLYDANSQLADTVVGGAKNLITSPPTNLLGASAEAANREYSRNTGYTGYTADATPEKVIETSQATGRVIPDANRQRLEAAASGRQGETQKPAFNTAQHNAPVGALAQAETGLNGGQNRGSYAYMTGQRNNTTPIGGWNSQADMIADNQRRKVKTTINGKTYTYFLKPGEVEQPTNQNRFQAAQTGAPGMAQSFRATFVNREPPSISTTSTRQIRQASSRSSSGGVITQDDLNQMGAYMAEGEDRQRQQRQQFNRLRYAENYKQREEALKAQLTNQLAQHYMDAGDMDQARALLGGGGAVKTESPYKSVLIDEYDENGMQTGQRPVAFNTVTGEYGNQGQAVDTGDSYQSAINEANNKVLVANPQARGEVIRRLRERYGAQFNENDLIGG